MAKFDLDDDLYGHGTPLIFVFSDARGETAYTVVLAAAAQFGDDSVEIKRLAEVKDVAMVRAFLDENYDPDRPCAVFHTFADSTLRRNIRRELDRRGIPSVDLLGPAVNVLSSLTGDDPKCVVGAFYNDEERRAREGKGEHEEEE